MFISTWIYLGLIIYLFNSLHYLFPYLFQLALNAVSVSILLSECIRSQLYWRIDKKHYVLHVHTRYAIPWKRILYRGSGDEIPNILNFEMNRGFKYPGWPKASRLCFETFPVPTSVYHLPINSLRCNVHYCRPDHLYLRTMQIQHVNLSFDANSLTQLGNGRSMSQEAMKITYGGDITNTLYFMYVRRNSKQTAIWCLIEIIQGDQKISVYLTITIQKVTCNVRSASCQSPDI
jgi:hypothetical protein